MAEIKETLEVLEAVEAVALVGAKVFEDGKLTVSDFTKLVDLAKCFNVLKDAVEGIGGVDDELKDLDEAEVETLVKKIFEISRTIKQAFDPEEA